MRGGAMHDVDEMTQQFRASLKEALEQQRQMLERQREINAKLDVLIETLAKALALATCDDVVIEDVPELQ
jgi:hypothetical protein